jgi:hypothetical protein
MNKLKLDLLEHILIFIIAVVTIITTPPIQLLAIPFVTILGMRGIFRILHNAENHGNRKQEVKRC